MDKHFGMHFLLQTYLGIASNIVEPGQREERKSIGAERYVLHTRTYFYFSNSNTRTFHAIGDKELILEKLEEVAAELQDDMENSGWTGKTVTLKYKLDTYQGLVHVLEARSAMSHSFYSLHTRKVLRQMDIDQEGGSVCGWYIALHEE